METKGRTKNKKINVRTRQQSNSRVDSTKQVSGSLLTYWSQMNPVLIEKRGIVLNGNRDINISAGLNGAGPRDHGI